MHAAVINRELRKSPEKNHRKTAKPMPDAVALGGYDSQFNSISQRMEGYRRAMVDAGLKPQMLIAENGAEVPRLVLKRLRGSDAPTAPVSLNNVTRT